MSLKFFKKILIFLSPIILLVLGYFIFDPFQILRVYEAYPDNYAKSLNRDHISTQIFLNNNSKYNYKSFIFGSSRSSAFYTKDWGKHINDETPYHFDASCETVYGMATKFEFIEKQGNKIDNALIIMDRSTFEYEKDTLACVFIQDYRVSQLSWLKYHTIFLNSYFSNGFFAAYYDYMIFKDFRKYMKTLIEFRKISYTPVVNDFIFTSYIEQIKKDSVAYYNQPNYFYKRSPEKQLVHKVIKPSQLQYLRRIKEALERNHTKYKIVVGLTYDQKYFNADDLKILEDIFGKEHIYDYSGQNEYTNDVSNYYEIYHYKPNVARDIMNKIYK